MKIVIIGAGITGMSAAYYLNKHNIKTIILEKKNCIGGLTACYKIRDFFIEKYYHHLFAQNTSVIDLIKENKLDNRLIWKKTKMGFFYKNKLYRFTSPLDLLFFTPLSFSDRLRFGYNTMYKKNKIDPVDLTAKEWLIKEYGESVYNIIFKNLLKSKFGSDMENIAAPFISTRLQERAKIRKITGEELGYLTGSFYNLFKCLIKKNKVILDAKVFKIKKKYIIYKRKKGMGKIKADYIIDTRPSKKVDYMSVISMIIGLKKKVTNFYWTTVISDDTPFNAIIEHTNLIECNNEHIIYLIKYLKKDEELWFKSKKELFTIFKDKLLQMFPHLSRYDILWYKISKDECASPIYTKDYLKNLPKNKNNIIYAGVYKEYPKPRNINSGVTAGFKAAQEVLKNGTRV